MNITVPREDRSFIYSANFATTPPASPLTIVFDGDSYFELTNIHAHGGERGTLTNIDNYTVQIRELGNSAQSFFNVPVMPGLVFSKATNGKTLRTPMVFPPNSTLQIDVVTSPFPQTQANGPASGLDLAFWGVKRYQMSEQEYAQRRQRPYFVYATPVFNASTIPITQFIQIATDADFVVQNICSYGDGGSTTNTGNVSFDKITVQITDESTQKQLFENPMPWTAISAQANHWRGNNRLLSPLIFRRNSLIRLDFAGTFSIGGTCDTQFGFEGYKIKD